MTKKSAFSSHEKNIKFCIILKQENSLNCTFFNQNQIKSLVLSHHHSTCALVSEILESVLQTVQKLFTCRQ